MRLAPETREPHTLNASPYCNNMLRRDPAVLFTPRISMSDQGIQGQALYPAEAATP